MLPMLLLVVGSAFACPGPVALDEISAMTAGSTDLFLNDTAKLSALATRVSVVLPCLTEPMTPALAVSWHELDALDAFTRVDDPATNRSFRAVLALNPAYVLPPPLQDNGFLTTAVEAARTAAPPRTESVTVPRAYDLLVDGRASAVVPREWPVVLQARRDGEVVWTKLQAPSEPLDLAFPTRHWPLLALAGATAATAGALGVGAALTVDRMSWDEDLAGLDSATAASTLTAWQRQVRLLDVGAGVAGAATLGLGALWYTRTW